MTFVFKNKIWVISKKRRIIDTALLICGIILFCITLFQIIMEGLSAIDLIPDILLPALLIVLGVTKTEKGKYVFCKCSLTIDNNRILLYYPDYEFVESKKEERTILIEKKDIVSIQYCDELKSLRLEYKKNSYLDTDNVSTSKNKNRKPIVLYPELSQIEKITETLENVLNIKIENID